MTLNGRGPGDDSGAPQVVATGEVPDAASVQRPADVAPYQLLPPLSADEYAALRDDIAAHGVRVPVDVDERGQLLDGHHRAAIAAELGIHFPTRVVDGLTEEEKREHAMALNMARRHLTQADRRRLIADELRRDDSRSDRRIARIVGVSHHTVGVVRRSLAGGQSAQSAVKPVTGPMGPEGAELTDAEVAEARERAEQIRAGISALDAMVTDLLASGMSRYEVVGVLTWMEREAQHRHPLDAEIAAAVRQLATGPLIDALLAGQSTSGGGA
jgi:ParB-like chromosome segregation protein Spo0J